MYSSAVRPFQQYYPCLPPTPDLSFGTVGHRKQQHPTILPLQRDPPGFPTDPTHCFRPSNRTLLLEKCSLSFLAGSIQRDILKYIWYALEGWLNRPSTAEGLKK
ncbi:unnamed protein product, partial [Nesidiocoris tenuis]